MTTDPRDAPERLPIPSEQIEWSGWQPEKAHYAARLLRKYDPAAAFVSDDDMGMISGVSFYPITKLTGRSYLQGSFGSSSDTIIPSQTVASTYPLLAALEEMRLDLVRQGAAVAALSKQFTHLAEEVHELRIGVEPYDTETQSGPSTAIIEHGLSDIASQGADEAQAAVWLNAAADAGCASKQALSLSEQSLVSPNAQVRAAAARVLALSGTKRSESLLRKASESEKNKLARAIMESALRALSTE